MQKNKLPHCYYILRTFICDIDVVCGEMPMRIRQRNNNSNPNVTFANKSTGYLEVNIPKLLEILFK